MDTILLNVAEVSAWAAQEGRNLLAVESRLNHIILLHFDRFRKHFYLQHR